MGRSHSEIIIPDNLWSQFRSWNGFNGHRCKWILYCGHQSVHSLSQNLFHSWKKSCLLRNYPFQLCLSEKIQLNPCNCCNRGHKYLDKNLRSAKFYRYNKFRSQEYFRQRYHRGLSIWRKQHPMCMDSRLSGHSDDLLINLRYSPKLPI